MLALRFDPRHLEADLSDEPDAYGGLETEVIAMLCCEGRVADNEVPRGRLNRGWWADSVPLEVGEQPALGSKLWLLESGGAMPRSVRLAERWALRALEPLTDNRRVSGVLVEGELEGMERINLAITLTLPNGSTVGPIRLQW